MEFDATLLPPRRAESIAKGWWHDRTINDELDACVAAYPNKCALAAVRLDSGELRRLSYRQLAALADCVADRVAVGLARLGVGRNDVVALQLPNWWQFSALYLACSRIGAVINPLLHSFRARELACMRKHGQAKLLIVPKLFRGFDHAKIVQDSATPVPSLKTFLGAGAPISGSLVEQASRSCWCRKARPCRRRSATARSSSSDAPA